ncbi:hypothetical protein DAPPUDRAFT_115656 [Daphnia pulex]|uniref:CUB domain-containing protein n=1 Tax=Daphnia pulex TaxID=6669 RepID=E9HM45_DAPPU|nr:hypothetical protein DAPPUDRAFT_115656 [Daphnia pulex]|eukprot:EFX67205.1 hypothetical protein DAPPUDRAFT_115656 [Daphnia pulex]
MKLFPIFFKFFLWAAVCLAVAAAQETRDCNAQKTPTKLMARRTWPSQTATTTAKPTTTTTSTTTAKATTTTPLPILFNCSVDNPGVVQSPNFPGDYGNEDRRCRVTITAPAGWLIQLNFTTFNVEIDKAYVQVSGDMGQPIMGGTNGNEIPGVVATTNAMSIGFFCFVSQKPSNDIYNWQATFSVSVITFQIAPLTVSQFKISTLLTDVCPFTL